MASETSVASAIALSGVDAPKSRMASTVSTTCASRAVKSGSIMRMRGPTDFGLKSSPSIRLPCPRGPRASGVRRQHRLLQDLLRRDGVLPVDRGPEPVVAVEAVDDREHPLHGPDVHRAFMHGIETGHV